MIPLLSALVLPAAAAQEWHSLAGSDARATSFLRSNWNRYEENYHPNYVLDDNPATGWVEGVSGNGEGQVLEWSISALSSARTVKVSVRNGYQKSEALLEANAAPKEVQISLLDGGGEAVVTERATLQRAMGWQEVVLHPAKAAAFSGVRVVVLSTWPGRKYQDTVISDVAVTVDSDVAYNAAAEAAKRARLAEWIRGRTETAAYFAALPEAYPFAGPHAETVGLTDVDTCIAATVAADLAPMLEVYGRLRATGAWYRRTMPAKVVPPDGVGLLGDVTPLVDAARVTWFEATAEIAREAAGEPAFDERRWWSNDRVEWATPPTPRHVYTWERVRGVERTTYDIRREVVVGYDVEGRAEWVLVVHTGNEDGRTDFAWRLHRRADGRVDAADASLYSYRDGVYEDEHTPYCTTSRLVFSP